MRIAGVSSCLIFRHSLECLVQIARVSSCGRNEELYFSGRQLECPDASAITLGWWWLVRIARSQFVDCRRTITSGEILWTLVRGLQGKG